MLVQSVVRSSVRRFAGRRMISSLLDPSHGLNDDQVEFLNVARQFADKEMAPQMAVWDREEKFPLECLKKSAELGFGGLYVREEFGGMGVGRLETSVYEFPLACV
eukprot:Partr_v1_DN25274_c0_g1_i2_m16725 putative acyl-CoA dehydrogenase